MVGGRVFAPAVGRPCLPDQTTHGDAAKLAGLKHPFTADLDMEQNAADQHGQFRWTRDIRGSRASGLFTTNGCEARPVSMPYRIYP